VAGSSSWTSTCWPRWSRASGCTTRATRSTTRRGARAASRCLFWARRHQRLRARNSRVRSRPLRFSPSAYQLLALDAAAGAAAYAVAMWLRFVDEGVPATYAQRLLPWLLAGALVQIGVGELMGWLRRPGSLLAHRPVAPYVVATLAVYLPLVLINE